MYLAKHARRNVASVCAVDALRLCSAPALAAQRQHRGRGRCQCGCGVRVSCVRAGARVRRLTAMLRVQERRSADEAHARVPVSSYSNARLQLCPRSNTTHTHPHEAPSGNRSMDAHAQTAGETANTHQRTVRSRESSGSSACVACSRPFKVKNATPRDRSRPTPMTGGLTRGAVTVAGCSSCHGLCWAPCHVPNSSTWFQPTRVKNDT